MTRTLIAFLLVAGLGARAAQAQSLEGLTVKSGAYYTFFEPGDITIEVKVWGTVGAPGLYEVRQGIKFSTLLSLAGGPAVGPQSSNISNKLSLRLFRPQADGRYVVVFDAEVEGEFEIFDQDPVLMHGDVLVAEETVRQRFGWRDALSIVSVAVGTAVLILQIERR